MVAESNRQRKGSAQTRQNTRHCFLRCAALLHQHRHKMCHDFAVGIAFEVTPGFAQFGAQFLEIFDDAIVDQSHMVRSVRVGILGGGRTVRGPARMGNTDLTGGRMVRQFHDQVVELPLGPATDQLAVLNRADTGAVVAAVFHPAHPVDKTLRNGLVADNTDNSAHGSHSPNSYASGALAVLARQSIGAANCSATLRSNLLPTTW